MLAPEKGVTEQTIVATYTASVIPETQAGPGKNKNRLLRFDS
jgi:hypothetical protein